jgi:PAS domain S-box-containing protein
MEDEQGRAKRLLHQLGLLQRELNDMREAKSVLRKTISELKSENKHCRALLENMPQHVSCKDLDGVYICCNRSYADFLRISPDEISGKTDFHFFPAETARKCAAYEDNVLKSGVSIEVDETVVYGGRTSIIHMVKAPVRDEKEKITGILTISWDVTEQRQAEERENTIREEFLASLTHNMKGPLSSILGYLELMEKPQLGSISEKKVEFVRAVRFSINTLLSMVQNIVDSSIIETGHLSFKFRHFPLHTLIRELTNIYGSMAMIGQLTLDSRCPEDIWVYADREKIREVLSNLISNAFRYTPPRGRISIDVTHHDESVVISVIDTGKGIPEADQRKIFQKFMRAGGECRGSGLGLYIVKNILEGHGSHIHLVSSPGKGTRFFFSLAKGMPHQSEFSMMYLVQLESDNKVGPFLMCKALKEEGFRIWFVRQTDDLLERAYSPDKSSSLIMVYRETGNIVINQFRELMKKDIAVRNIPVRLISILDLQELEEEFSTLMPFPINFHLFTEEMKMVSF